MSLAPLKEAVEQAYAAVPRGEPLRDEEAERIRQRLLERLGRDLRPRLAGDAPALLLGIAGPNNVGKSSLFNALAGASLSPARAEGGLTKQCLAAAHPALWAEVGPVLEARYDVERVPEGTTPGVDAPGPPGRLYLVLSERLPRTLLIIDTPDFDSVYARNRVNAEALLVTVDLVAFVVSRQSYQNAALVDFLREVVGHGRPYLLIYNEATRPEIARGHLETLAGGVGHAPWARFYAAHQPDVEEGRAFLKTESLDGSRSLQQLLDTPGEVAALKAQAMRASAEDAAAELRALAKATAAEAQPAQRLRERLRHELRAVGERAAHRGVPADVLVEAFRDELDARSPVHRFVRTPFRALASALTSVGRQARRAFVGGEPQPSAAAAPPEEAALKDGLRRAVEALASEVPEWQGDAQTGLALREAMGPQTLSALSGRLELPELRESPADRAALYAFCRELVRQELAQHAGTGREMAMQTLTTLVYSVPAGAAAAATVATGGMGHDVVVWAGTLLSTPLLERFVDMLGAQVRTRVTQRWAESHGATLAAALERRFFAALVAHLDAQASEGEARSRALSEAARALSAAVPRGPST